MAVVEYRVVRAVRLLELVERLRDEERLEPVAGDERKRGLEELQLSERGKLVEQEQEPVPVGGFAPELHRLGQAASDLVEHQADDGARPREVTRRHDEVGARRRVAVHEVRDPEVALGGVSRDDRIAVEAKARHRGREDARELVVALVERVGNASPIRGAREHFASSKRHEGTPV